MYYVCFVIVSHQRQLPTYYKSSLSMETSSNTSYVADFILYALVLFLCYTWTGALYQCHNVQPCKIYFLVDWSRSRNNCTPSLCVIVPQTSMHPYSERSRICALLEQSFLILVIVWLSWSMAINCDGCCFQVAADGNWLHIHYQSKLQAKKALSKNGKVFGGSIMIGVMPCIDKVIITCWCEIEICLCSDIIS